MVNIIKEELPIEESLKKKLELICEFSKVAPTIINGNIRNIDKTNLSYIEPHRIIIKGITFLAFNYSKTLFVGNLSNKLELKDLEWIVGSVITILGLIFGVSFVIKKNVQKSGRNSTNIQIGEINYDKRK